MEPGLSSTGRTGSEHLNYFNQIFGPAQQPFHTKVQSK